VRLLATNDIYGPMPRVTVWYDDIKTSPSVSLAKPILA
jgi:hypothetical protein